MKRTLCLFPFVLLAASAYGQQAPPQKVTMVTGWRAEYDYLKLRYTKTVEAMPAGDYGFKPIPSVKTFGQIIGHDINAQFRQCSTVLGEPNPNKRDLEKLGLAKAELVKALNESYALCDRAFAAATEQTLSQFVPQGMHSKPGSREEARGLILAEVLRHGSRGDGVATLYLKLKGLDRQDPERLY